MTNKQGEAVAREAAKVQIEKVRHFEMSTREIASFMIGWHRVIDVDGSTVAYAPDRITALQIAKMIGGGDGEATKSIIGG